MSQFSTFENFIAPYRIEKELGRGGFSRVYLATRISDEKRFAIKVIAKDPNNPSDGVLRELKIQSQFDSPYIVNVYDSFEDNEQIVFVIEYVNGGELFDAIVQKGSYSEKEAADLIQQVLLGLKILHSNQVIHRDLKPENLLLMNNEDGTTTVKISDFGLAGLYDGSEQMKTYCGTEGYAAPEIMKNIPYNDTVDIWSLGVIIYIILSGFRPFEADDRYELYQQVIKADYEFFSPEWDSISQEAKDLISRMLQVQPERRITIDQALSHPWIKGNAPQVKLGDLHSHMRQYNLKRKLKRTLNAAKAANQFLHLAALIEKQQAQEKGKK